MSSIHVTGPDSLGREFLITRQFNAPRELVFRAWTNPQHIAVWWGPKGFTNPVCEWDARPGGQVYVVMRAPDGMDFPMGGEFREILPPEKLVMTTGALDEQGKLLFEFLHTLILTEQNGKTNLVLRSRVIRTTPGADRYIGGFEMGMTMSLERLEEHLAQGTAPVVVEEIVATPPATPIPAGTADREIMITRDYQAPRELVWEAMANPEHVAKWWGPRGFTTTIEVMDFRVGGVWKHVMHGPDGTNYPNKSIFREIVKPERIVYTHGGGREQGPGASFTATWTFEALAADRTRLTGRMVFGSAEERDFVVREFGASEGGRQTLMRLSERLSEAQCPAFTIFRSFNAPRELVWKAWTEQGRLMEWFGPKGCTIPVAQLDFRVDGQFHYCMRTPDGNEMWGLWIFREIAAPERIVLANSFSDTAGNPARPPFPGAWSLQMLTETTFTELEGKTTVTLRWFPLDATEAERQNFNAMRPSFTQGWKGTFDQLDEYLAKA